jgi:hypothetical protein
MPLPVYSEISEPPIADESDFSLVLGGPLFQLYRRMRLSGAALELLRRRIVVITIVVWLPLLLFSIIDGRTRSGIKIPFLYDVETHVRFLIALPALIAADVVVLGRISPLVRRFVERRIVLKEDLGAFNAAVNTVLRVRNSVAAELMLLSLVYTLGIWIWRNQHALGIGTWYARPDATHLHLNLAGYWYVFVSIPFFQFILLRWYLRLALWFRLLWQISRLNLHLTAAHPDRAGGIGFVGTGCYAFSPILFAQGAILSGMIASRVFYEGRNLLSFKMEAAGFVGFFVLVILGPLVVFSPCLLRTRRKGLAEYGLLANRYVFGFEEKWIRGGTEDSGELLGSGDIQSLADLGNSYSVVREMRVVPFGLEDVARLAGAACAPLLPLMLAIISLEELLTRLVKVIL